MPTRGSSAYVYADPNDLITARKAEEFNKHVKNHTTTGRVAILKPPQKPKKARGKTKAKTNGPTPLRVIDLHEDDATDIAMLKLQRTAQKGKMKANNNIGDQSAAQSAITSGFLFRPSDRKTLAGGIGKKPRITPISPGVGEEPDTVPLLVFNDDDGDGGNAADGEDEGRGDVKNMYWLPILRPPPRPQA